MFGNSLRAKQLLACREQLDSLEFFLLAKLGRHTDRKAQRQADEQVFISVKVIFTFH
jgi:hypothetical protein